MKHSILILAMVLAGCLYGCDRRHPPRAAFAAKIAGSIWTHVVYVGPIDATFVSDLALELERVAVPAGVQVTDVCAVMVYELDIGSRWAVVDRLSSRVYVLSRSDTNRVNVDEVTFDSIANRLAPSLSLGGIIIPADTSSPSLRQGERAP
jgi:hypothetical protein